MKKNFQIKILKYSHFLKKFQLNYFITKSISSDLRLKNVIRFFGFFFIFNSFVTKLNYFCVQTNQLRGLIHFFNTFRMNFRESALFGRYAGLKKKSW